MKLDELEGYIKAVEADPSKLSKEKWEEFRRDNKTKPNVSLFDDLKLGKLIGEGGNKDVYEIMGDPDKVVAVLKKGKPLDAIDKEIELLTKLSDNNLPVVEIIEKGMMEGKPAVIMKRYAQGSKDVVKRVGKKMAIVGESSYLNQKSIGDLSKIKRQLNDQKISIDDLQFIIGKDGSVVIADPLAVYLNVAPTEWNIKMINKLIEASSK